MKILKNFLAVTAIAAVISFSGLSAFAQEVGVVDIERVIGSYSKAQSLAKNLREKEIEIQNFLADAQKKLKDASTPVERKNLEQKFSGELKKKSQDFRQTEAREWQKIHKSVLDSIQEVSKKKKIDLILNKAGVLLGGTDLTDEVLKSLNK